MERESEERESEPRDPPKFKSSNPNPPVPNHLPGRHHSIGNSPLFFSDLEISNLKFDRESQNPAPSINPQPSPNPLPFPSSSPSQSNKSFSFQPSSKNPTETPSFAPSHLQSSITHPQPQPFDQPPIYFENFPDNCSISDLINLFGNSADIIHLHVARNKNKHGKRFGFIHVSKGYNLNRVVSSLNERWIGTYKIRANIALFDKHHRRRFASAHPNSPSRAPVGNLSDFSKSLPRASSSMIYNKNGAIPEWLSRSSLGVLKSLDLLTRIHNVFSEHNFDVQIKPLGGCEVIISFSSLDSMKKAYEDNSWISEFFYVWRPWQCRDIASGRFIWLNISRVPLHIWETKFFSDLVIGLGDFICVSKETERKERLDIAKVLVSTSDMKSIDRIIKVHVDGESFDIRIFEDKTQDFILDLNQSFVADDATVAVQSLGPNVDQTFGSPPNVDLRTKSLILPADNSSISEEVKMSSEDLEASEFSPAFKPSTVDVITPEIGSCAPIQDANIQAAIINDSGSKYLEVSGELRKGYFLRKPKNKHLVVSEIAKEGAKLKGKVKKKILSPQNSSVNLEMLHDSSCPLKEAEKTWELGKLLGFKALASEAKIVKSLV